MTSPLFDIPNIPVSTNNATTYTHATTFLELVDMLRVQISGVSHSMESYSDSLNGLIDNVNQACQSALAACKKLSVDAATMNADTTAKLDVAAGNLAAAKHDLDMALVASNAALASAQHVLDSYQDDVARQDSDIQAGLNDVSAQIQGYVKKNTFYFNVRDFGAVGDGVTDDSQAFMTCFAAARGKGVVLVPAGKFVIAQPITIPSDSIVQGTGTYDGQTGNPANCVLVTVPPSAYTTGAVTVGVNSHVRDITFKGNQTGTALYCYGSCTLSNVNVQGFNVGIQCSSLWYGHFNNLRMLYNAEAVKMDYCYNCTFIEPRFTCRNWDNRPRRGFTLSRNIELKVIGGAIESYDNAFKFDTTPYAQSLYCSGVYFEANAPVADYHSQYGAIAVNAENTGQTSVKLMGCHIYLTNTKSFIRFNTANKGVLVSIGNKIKGGPGGPYTAYYAESNGSTNVARVMMGDDVTSASPGPIVYVTPPPANESYSHIVMPFGSKSQ